MEHIVADAPPTRAPKVSGQPIPIPAAEEVVLAAFSDLLRTFLLEFAKARSEPFQKTVPLWNSMSDVKTRIEQFPAVKNRPDLVVSISVGQGNWATVPWIALLNARITKSTQEGVYIVYLIAAELDRIFLTLNQGTTNLVRELGHREARKRMLDVANKSRVAIGDLAAAGFILDNNISLGGDSWLAKNYEMGTIAHYDFGASDIPNDEQMNALLKAALDAYDRAVDAPVSEPSAPDIVEPEVPAPVVPYSIDDALSELFLSSRRSSGT
jgi:hypothetical protein